MRWKKKLDVLPAVAHLLKQKKQKKLRLTIYKKIYSVSVWCVCFLRIIQRTIRAAVEQHFLELKTSTEQDLSSYDSQGWVGAH